MAAASHPLGDELVDSIAGRFRALGDATRVKLLDRLRDGEATVTELTELTGATQQNVSKHLTVLLQAGVVARRKAGNFAYYRIADPTVLSLCATVCGALADDAERRRRAFARF